MNESSPQLPPAGAKHQAKELIKRLRPSLTHQAEVIRERLERVEDKRLLSVARAGRDICWPEGAEREPLVTVRIPTYNRGPLVVERAIASALNQTYDRIEILVIGDSCDEKTETAVRSVKDPRLRFINLPARGMYPSNPDHRWMVAGTAPMNAGLVLAKGQWIAPCDDDDELTDDHVEVLVRAAVERRLEMVYSKAKWEVSPDNWVIVGSEPLQQGRIVHGSVLYSSGLRFLRHSNTSWRRNEPGDWNLWRRMASIGVRIGFLDHVTFIHHLENRSDQL